MVAAETEKPPVWDYPPLTVLPVWDDPTRFYVLGKSGWWYEVKLASESQSEHCECKGYGFRGRCSHLDAVWKHLREKDPCPVCHGNPWIEPDPQVGYVTAGKKDGAPIPRLCCGGTGTRYGWVEGGRVGTVKVAELTEDERRAIFR